MIRKSPYLLNDNRLADVIAAIQAMGSYKFYKRSFEEWADRIVGDKTKALYWKQIFIDHPEFFRLDSKRENASLVWRRQISKRYNVDTQKIFTRDEFYALTDAEKDRVSRIPLTPENIAVLIDSAIDLHSRELERLQDKDGGYH